MGIIIPRSVWQPRYSNGFAVIGTRDWEAAGRELWLHHSVTVPPGPDATLAQDCEHMRHFEQIGQTSFGGGISYTWVVMPSGRVFEGHSIDRRGAHTYQRNDRSRAICLAGNFDTTSLPRKMFNSVVMLLREIGATIDGPHSAVYATACPGRYAREQIGAMNSVALSGNPIEGEDDMFEAQDRSNLNDITKTPGGAERIIWLNEVDARLKNIEMAAVKTDAAVSKLAASGVPVDLQLSATDKNEIAELVAEKLAARMAD